MTFIDQTARMDWFNAVLKEDLVTLMDFLHQGISVNILHPISQFTALMYASYFGQTSMVALLLKNGADIHACDSNDNNALIFSVIKKHMGISELLLQEGAWVDHVNQKGDTALMYAAQSGHPGLVKLLLQHKAQLNYQNHEGMSALMYAASMNHLPVVKLLIQEGAQWDLKNHQGLSALQLAEPNHPQVFHFLKSFKEHQYLHSSVRDSFDFSEKDYLRL